MGHMAMTHSHATVTVNSTQYGILSLHSFHSYHSIIGLPKPIGLIANETKPYTLQLFPMFMQLANMGIFLHPYLAPLGIHVVVIRPSIIYD